MNVFQALSVLLIGVVVSGESTDANKELTREKKDISKLQALFGWDKNKLSSIEQWKRPPYYAPQYVVQGCSCWRPSTRYGLPEDSYVVYPSQPVRVAAVRPAQPALALPAQTAYTVPLQGPSYVVPAVPARLAPPPGPAQVLPASPALVAADCPPSRQQNEGYSYDRPHPQI